MKEVPELTGMRGYASLGVVIFHFFTVCGFLRTTGFAPFNMILSWDSGVDFFFVLSGFLLSVPFMAGRTSLKVYYLKRIFRILPVYYLSIVSVGAFSLYIGHATLQQVEASLFFAQSFSPSTFNSVNGVNWTLVIEEIFYVTLPIFSTLFVKGRWRFALPACLGAAAAYRVVVVSLYPHSVAFHLWQYPSFVGHYAIGATLANLYVNKRMAPLSAKPALLSGLAVVLLLASQFWIGSAYSVSNNTMAFPGMLFALEYGALIYLTLSLPSASRMRSLFTNRLAKFAGKISYSTYTWHLPILVGLYQLGLPILIWVILTLCITFCLANASYNTVEKHSQLLRDRLLARLSRNAGGYRSASLRADTRGSNPG